MDWMASSIHDRGVEWRFIMEVKVCFLDSMLDSTNDKFEGEKTPSQHCRGGAYGEYGFGYDRHDVAKNIIKSIIALCPRCCMMHVAYCIECGDRRSGDLSVLHFESKIGGY